MTIKVVPEYWAQPGKVTYHYVHKQRRILVNVCTYSDDGVTLWSINAWGNTTQWRIPRKQFDTEYERIKNPKSMYDEMRDAVSK